MSVAATLVLVCLLSACTGTPESDPNTEEWISLFNGQDLDGWDVKIAGYDLGDNYAETFSVRDSVMIADFSGYDEFDSRFGVIVYREPFSYYRLRVTYRFVGEQVTGGPGWAYRNSGLMLHSQSAASMLKDQNFPISIEVQLLGGNGTDDRPTLNLCTPGTNVVMGGELITQHCVNSSSATYHGDGWVTAEIEVLGSERFIHRIDGQTVLEHELPQMGGGAVSGHDPAVLVDGLLLSGGYIGLQSESHPVQFKSVELLNLRGCMDPSSARFKTYYVDDDPGAC
jgi:hypothetical protein